MALLDDILVWTQTLPEWEQDAARRLFQNPEGLSDNDYGELFALLKAEHGLSNSEAVFAVPLSRGHLPQSLVSGETITLEAMHDFKYVNCIDANQVLTFKSVGPTLIYGGNGSGKSGYARVMKRACRARDEKEQVLPDAKNPAATNCVPEAVFDLKLNNVAKSVHWLSSDDPPEELASVAVFDRHCARLYLTTAQEVAYLPYGLDILEALANQVLPEINRRLDQELSGLDIDVGQYATLLGDTDVGRTIADLDHTTTPEQIRTLGKLSKDELQRIEELDRTLGETAPAEKAKQFRFSAERLKELVKRVESANGLVGKTAITKLKVAVQEMTDADNAEQAAAKLLDSDKANLAGTGEAAWKTLFEAARQFSVNHAYPDKSFPNTADDAVCVLCQQSLHGATERMERFAEYVQSDVAKTAASKRAHCDKAMDDLRRATLDVRVDKSIATELNELDGSIGPMILDFERSIRERRDKVLEAVESSAWESVPPATSNPRQILRNLAAKQYWNARDYERACDEASAAALRKEQANLTARKTLTAFVNSLLALLERLKKKNALEECRNDLNTKSISIKSKELASTAVTSALKVALDAEFNALDIGHIETKLKDRTVKGRVLHQLVLDVPTNNKVEDILSEGEQRAIALAAFLAELTLTEHLAAIVFDDPVSSLDHKRRRRVAQRLAVESRRRQVIIFTHDVVFLNQLKEECRQQNITPGVRCLERIGMSAGVIREELPWDHKSCMERIDSLEKEQKRFEKLPWPSDPHEELARDMIQQYSFLRATIERVVQDVFLNGTVRRFEEYIQIRNLKKVVGLRESEVQELTRLYQRCHDLVEAHDRASAIDDVPPTDVELRIDIEALKTLIQGVRDRRKN